MSDREASLQELLVASFQSQMNNVHTAIPCIVVAIRNNGNEQLVDIQPTINQKMKDGSVRERPVIMGVPIGYPVSDSSGILFEINPGVTTGLAVFSMRNMDGWKSGNGRPSAPLNFGKMDKQDAVFYPGIQPPSLAVNHPSKHLWPHSPSDTVVFHNLGKETETEIRLLKSGGVVINTNQDVEANCKNLNANVELIATINANDLVIDVAQGIDLSAATMTVSVPSTSWSGAINHTGSIVNTGAITSNTVTLSTHNHGGNPPVPGT